MVRSRVQSELVGSSLESFESVLTRDDLRMLWGFYFIPAEFEIVLVDLGGRVDYPPSGYLGVYKEALKANLRFPLHSFIVKLLNVYLLSSAQIMPNSWRFIIGFLSLCFLWEVEPTINLFRTCYLLKPIARDES